LLTYGAGAVGGLALLTGGGWGLLGMVRGGRADSTRISRRLSILVLVIALPWTIRSMVVA